MNRQDRERWGGGKADIPLDEDSLPESPQDKRPGLLTEPVTFFYAMALPMVMGSVPARVRGRAPVQGAKSSERRHRAAWGVNR